MQSQSKTYILLTHLPLDNMATNLADGILKWIFLLENDITSIQISLKFVPRSPIDNQLALVQVVACCLISTKPLPESMMIQFIAAYMRH